jgi:Fe-S-cluster containining protein
MRTNELEAAASAAIDALNFTLKTIGRSDVVTFHNFGVVQRYVQKQADLAAERAIKEFPNFAEIGCRKGCTFCCYQDIQISIPEAFRIALLIRNEDQKQRIRNTAEELDGIDPMLRYRLHIPCFFLDTSSKLCTIYERRPTICRVYLSPARWVCESDWQKAPRPDYVESKDAMFLSMPQSIGLAAQQGADAALYHKGLQMAVFKMEYAISVALEPGALVSWLNKEQVFDLSRQFTFLHHNIAYSKMLDQMLGDLKI